jgi:hypothetical protein
MFGARSSASLLRVLLGTCLGCEPNVVDAVTLPEPVPDAGLPPEPPPVDPLQSWLIHRYSFDKAGSEVLDSKGAAHGVAVNVTLPGDGSLSLAGLTSNEFVNLPNGLISGLRDATIEGWLTWDGGGAWQRIFDFGSNASGEDVTGGTAVSYLFLTTRTPAELSPMLPAAMRVSYSTNGVLNETVCHGLSAFPVGIATHFAVVVSETEQSLSLYQDGELLNECPFQGSLAAIDDINNWLGRSNYMADEELAGTYDEYRMYGAELTPSELEDSYRAGPNAGRE